jgi:hypothetical protein
MFQVRWKPTARNQLAELWMQADSIQRRQSQLHVIPSTSSWKGILSDRVNPVPEGEGFASFRLWESFSGLKMMAAPCLYYACGCSAGGARLRAGIGRAAARPCSGKQERSQL